MARRKAPQLWRMKRKWAPRGPSPVRLRFAKRGHPLPARAGRGQEQFLLLRGFLATLLERGAENVAERRARVGGAVLSDRLLLLGDFQRLDRHADLAGLLVELRHAGIDLLADRETLGPLLGAIAREVVAL